MTKKISPAGVPLIRFALATIVAKSLLLSAAIAGQADLLASVPTSRTLTFKAITGDTVLGAHKVTFKPEGDALLVTTEIDLEATVLYLPVYRYKHRSLETWRGGELVALASKTNDDGTPESVDMMRDDANAKITATAFTGVSALPLAPTSYWAYKNLKKKHWINTQTGTILNVSVRPLGSESIKTRSGPIQARRYDINGDVNLSLWYDARNHWVKTRFTIDGTTITYELQ